MTQRAPGHVDGPPPFIQGTGPPEQCSRFVSCCHFGLYVGILHLFTVLMGDPGDLHPVGLFSNPSMPTSGGAPGRAGHVYILVVLTEIQSLNSQFRVLQLCV